MAKSVLELAVGTGQWDAGLKKAKTALDNFTQANGGLQSALNKDSQSMQTFVQMMGKMDSQAKTAKGQMNDYKSTIEALTMQYNRMTDAQKAAIGQDYLQAIDQMKQKYQGVASEVDKINQSLKQTTQLSADAGSGGGGGGIGSKFTDMLSVAGGSLIAQGATKLAGELQATIQQSVELARAGEGIRVAFDKLNNPGLLANLREATHGTVTDIELMKAAVKFNDFKLPVEELGTMLAFAQQKAKDTGQSVDYMVDSIVTGLGRKSLMILDNLGLSATQIRERMKEGGDMTKAVGEIIREEMAKAGDYVETAADRAARAAAQTKNEMEELGRAAMPVAEEFDKAWNTIKIGGMQLMNKVLTPMANSLKWIQETLGSTSTELFEKAWSKAKGEVGSNVDDNGNYIRRPAQKGATGFDWDKGTWKPGYTGAIYNSATGQTELPEVTVQGHTPTKTTSTGGGGGGGNRQQINITFNADKAALAGEHGTDTMPSVWGMLDDEGLRKMMGIGRKQDDLNRDITEKDYKKLEGYQEEKDDKKTTEQLTKLTSGLSSITSGIKSMGIELPKEVDQVIGVIQGIISVIEGVNTVVSVFGNTTMAANTAALIANTAALQVAAATNLIPLAGGGIVPHAAGGYMIGGNSFSGDNIYAGGAWVNSGELVLNKAQQSTLATQLQGQDRQMHVVGELSGEKIILVANRTFRRKGQGEIVTW